MADQVAEGAVLSITSLRAIDHAGIADRHLLVANSQPLRHARTISLHEHVGPLHHPQEHFSAGSAFQIEAYRAFVAVERVERRTCERSARSLGSRLASLLGAAPGRRTRFFHSDHIRAQVSKDHRTEGAERKLGQVQNLESSEWRL